MHHSLDELSRSVLQCSAPGSMLEAVHLTHWKDGGWDDKLHLLLPCVKHVGHHSMNTIATQRPTCLQSSMWAGDTKVRTMGAGWGGRDERSTRIAVHGKKVF